MFHFQPRPRFSKTRFFFMKRFYLLESPETPGVTRTSRRRQFEQKKTLYPGYSLSRLRQPLPLQRCRTVRLKHRDEGSSPNTIVLYPLQRTQTSNIQHMIVSDSSTFNRSTLVLKALRFPTLLLLYSCDMIRLSQC